MGLPGGRPKGSKNKSTLEKEARRAVFDAEVSKVFINTIKKARPEYLLDQFMGKAPDIIEGGIEFINFPKEDAKD